MDKDAASFLKDANQGAKLMNDLAHPDAALATILVACATAICTQIAATDPWVKED